MKLRYNFEVHNHIRAQKTIIIPCISVFMFLNGNGETKYSVPNCRKYSLKKGIKS